MKKIFSVMIIMALFMTTAIPAFGSTTSESRLLETAIQNARAVIDIPSEASIFESSSWEDPISGRIWSLNWRDQNFERSFNVTIDADGNIISFWSFEQRENEGLATMSRAQGQQIAEDFLSKVVSSDIDVRLHSSFSNTGTFSYIFMAYVNDFPVHHMSFHIDVDRFAERVSSYSRARNAVAVAGNLTMPNEIINEEDAREAFLEAAGVSLIYNSNFDWATRELRVFPSYIVNVNQFIDAETGELTSEADRMSLFGRHGAGADVGRVAADAESSVQLTPEERGAVDDIAGVISRDQAVRAAIANVPGLTSSSEVLSAGLHTFGDGRGHGWFLQFDGDYSVAVDAHTGNLISFFNFALRDSNARATVSLERAKTTARDFVRRVAADKVNQTVLSENNNFSGIQPFSFDGGMTFTFTFVREVNNIQFPGNSINMSIDAATGNIVNFDLRWHYDIDFPAIHQNVTAAEALDIFAGENEFKLFYTQTADGMRLVYGFMSMPEFVIDPATGELLGFDGNPFVNRNAVVYYDDIAGRWYESIVTTLLDNGFFIEGTSFNGSAQITQEEFLRFLYAPSQAFFTQEEFYNILVQSRVILREEIAPERIITRQEAAKIVIRYMRLELAARDGSIFRNAFADEIAESYLGYAMVARALGIMQGDTAGNFNGAANMTRAQAAVVIHNLLNVR